jgi:hypothetical protein
VYQYPVGEEDRAVQMIKVHCEEGALHPYAALMLVAIARGL